MLISLMLLAGVLMLTSAYSLICNLLFWYRSTGYPKHWKKLFLGSLLAGLLLALTSWLGTFFFLLPYRNIVGDGWFAGLPFVAVYIDGNDNYYDFSFTRLSMLANIVFWFLLPMSGLHLYGQHWRRRQAKAAQDFSVS